MVMVTDDAEGEGEGGSRYEVLLLGDNKLTLFFGFTGDEGK